MGNGINKVLPGLYLGNFRDAKDQKQLAENHITHILSIHDNAKPILEDKKYLCINAADTPDQDLLPYFRSCVKFIHEASLAGISRSVTVSVAYIITLTTHDWRDALSAVRCAREVANPNLGFTHQLQKYQNEKVEKERIWLRKTYPKTDSAEDQRLIGEMCQKYNKSINPEKQNPPSEQGSGSASASYPVNKDAMEESSNWDHKNRCGLFGDDVDRD